MSLMVVATNESELPALQNAIRDYVRNAFTKRRGAAKR